MKFTLFVTQQCNLRCTYCYIEKRQQNMSLEVAKKVVDFMFQRSMFNDEEIDIGFFGGEPLLELNRISAIIDLVKAHPVYPLKKIHFSIVTNGTIFNDEIAEFVHANEISFGISCDGPSKIHDRFRRTKSGKKTSAIVERNIKQAKEAFSNVMVNAVYHPDTFRELPETVEYFSALGVRQIYLNPDFSAQWSQQDISEVKDIYDRIGELYTHYYFEGKPHFISLIDSKIGVILKGGYQPLDRCRMGKAEFAFTADGDIYPCERLVGDGHNDHWIGNVMRGMNRIKNPCHLASGEEQNEVCTSCGIKEYCMNWCGCSNYMSTGFYNRVSPFLCVSEKAAMRTSFEVFQKIESVLGPTFQEHAFGNILMNSFTEPIE